VKTVPRSPIRVEFRRSGGFAGIPIAATVEADQLSEEHAPELHRLLTAGEAPRRPKGASPGMGADRFQYQISIDDGQQHRTITWDETDIPDSARPLLEELTRLSRPVPIR
jgi:hypothetical protein